MLTQAPHAFMTDPHIQPVVIHAARTFLDRLFLAKPGSWHIDPDAQVGVRADPKPEASAIVSSISPIDEIKVRLFYSKS